MAILKYELRQLRFYTLWWALASALFIYAALPSYLDLLNPAALETSSLGDAGIFSMLGVDVDVLTAPIGVFGFLTSVLVIAAGINGMFAGLKTFSNETIRKSAEFIYTKPFSRNKVFCAKISAALISVLIVGICYYAASMASAFTNVSQGFDFGQFSLVALSFPLTGLFFVLFGALVGVLHPKIRTPLLLSTGAVFLFYVLAAFAGKMQADVIKLITPFSYFSTSSIVNSGGYAGASLAALVVLCICFSVIGITVFAKKDITILS